jgi:hypothetical protein
MALATNHQVIWKRKGEDHKDLELTIPPIINSDIGFQLMFGVSTNYLYDKEQEEKHHMKYAKESDLMTLEDVLRKFK